MGEIRKIRGKWYSLDRGKKVALSDDTVKKIEAGTLEFGLAVVLSDEFRSDKKGDTLNKG